MPTNLTDVDAWSTPISVPIDGDVEAAASVVAAFQSLANRTTNVRKGVAGVAASFTHRVLLSQTATLNVSARFTLNTTSGILMWQQTDTTDAGQVQLHLAPTPLLGKVDRIAAWVCGGTGAMHAALPATKPSIKAYKFDGVSGSATQLGVTATDASASVAAYETPHYIAVSSLAEPIISGKEFGIGIFGEAGANAVNNAFRVLGLEITFIP